MDDRKRPAKDLNDEDGERPTKRERLRTMEERSVAPVSAATAARARAVATTTTATTSATADDDEASQSWTPEMHRAFVETIFKIGMQRASPRAIEHNMQQSEKITAERIKSHLQKYRKNKEKSTREFMAEYDAFLAKQMAEARVFGGYRPMRAPANLSGAQIAANLSFNSIMHNSPPSQSLPNGGPGSGAPQFVNIGITPYGVQLPYPNLTDEESRSPVGVALYHVVETVRSMTNHLQSTRRSRTTATESSAAVSIGEPYNGQHASHSRRELHDEYNNNLHGQQTSDPQNANARFTNGNDDDHDDSMSMCSTSTPLPFDFFDPM